jgi:DNA-binding protein HU-beta
VGTTDRRFRPKNDDRISISHLSASGQSVMYDHATMNRSLHGTHIMTKQFISEIMQHAGPLTGVTAKRIAARVLEAIQTELLSTGRFTLPGFGTFTVKETVARTRFNPRNAEPVQVKAGATVRFKAAPNLKTAALTATKKAKRTARKPRATSSRNHLNDDHAGAT